MKQSDFFDQVAGSDDPLLFTDDDRQRLQTLRERLGDISGCRVLEPGCGAGPLTELIAEWVGPNGLVHAFDRSEGMVRLCRERLAGRRIDAPDRPASGSPANVRISHACAGNLIIEPGAWDLILVFRVFPHFDEKTYLLDRLRDGLADGGRLVIANLDGSARLNELHGTMSMPVRHDHMPCLYGTTRLLENSGYRVRQGVDNDDGFFVEAVRA